MTETILVAGIGNIFMSDDGFGVSVANRLAERDLPARVKVADYGIRGIHLAYELLGGYEALILVDAIDMRDAPGTLTVIEPDPDSGISGDGSIPVDAHSMSPEVVLGTLTRLGGSLGRIAVVGCQPASLEEGIGLSPPVAAAIEPAIGLCTQLVAEILRPVRKEART